MDRNKEKKFEFRSAPIRANFSLQKCFETWMEIFSLDYPNFFAQNSGIEFQQKLEPRLSRKWLLKKPF